MSLIDWSDPDEMLGLLVEYVADERIASHIEPERAQFMNGLWEALGGIAEQESESVEQVARYLREVLENQPREFADDPVLAHVEACIEELHRIGDSNEAPRITLRSTTRAK